MKKGAINKMKGKIAIVASILFFLGFAFVSCSKKDDKKAKPTQSVSIFVDGVEINNSITLHSYQIIQLDAVLKDVDGTPIEDYQTVWDAKSESPSDWGDFISATNSRTPYFRAKGGSLSTSYPLTITADCNGIKQSIKITGVTYKNPKYSLVIEGAYYLKKGTSAQYTAYLYINDILENNNTATVTWSR
jgi:hypothetical protein